MITFDEALGRHSSFDMDGHADESGDVVLTAERRYALQDIFKKNNGLMRAPVGFHYVKPSGKHVDGFLRTSNILEDGWSCATIAFWLLPYTWRRAIEYIVVDTSGISSVAMELAWATEIMPEKHLPIIWSHQSYDGLAGLSIPNPEKTLILISASTSGSLRKELINHGAIGNNIVTLFFLGKAPENSGHILCDLTKNESHNLDGIDPLENHNESDCPHCQNQSFSVKLAGDQFSFEPPRVEEVEFALSDLPSKQRDAIDRFAGTGFFKVYRQLDRRQLEIFLDVSALFPAEALSYKPTVDALNKLMDVWKALIRRGLPIHIRRIVHASYPFSKELAEFSEGVLRNHHGNHDVIVTDARNLRQIPPIPETATLVVAACLDDAHELMSINRDLREIQPHGNTTYIAPVFRTSTKREKERVRSNLTFGENGPNTFSLFSAYELELPECSFNHSWKTELESLRKMVEWADLENRDVPDSIHRRIVLLEDAPAKGLDSKLFWPDLGGRELQIRPDFTLMNTDGGARLLSQADVFIAISAALHSLRAGVKGKPRLSYKPYERAVLSPDNFQRFNDGVIHAALLRAARSFELAFSNCDDALSGRMKDMIVSQISKVDIGEGESLMEFLLALITKRLTLMPHHTRDVLDAFLGATSLPDHLLFAVEYLQSRKAE